MLGEEEKWNIGLRLKDKRRLKFFLVILSASKEVPL
jgi:hypothetical protein